MGWGCPGMESKHCQVSVDCKVPAATACQRDSPEWRGWECSRMTAERRRTGSQSHSA